MGGVFGVWFSVGLPEVVIQLGCVAGFDPAIEGGWAGVSQGLSKDESDPTAA